MQLSIEEFLMHPKDPHDKDHELLLNPLSAEFGVRTAKGMEILIQDTLPDFKLVRKMTTWVDVIFRSSSLWMSEFPFPQLDKRDRS